jgi:acyl-CoA dehydrogenase
VDLNYPIHRNLLWGRQIANQIGNGGGCLERLGELVASGLPTVHGVTDGDL